MPFTGLHADPEGYERLCSKLKPVCASVSAGNQVTKDQLKDIARAPKRNPFNYLTKNNQSFSNTCAANSGELTLSSFFWSRTGTALDFSRLWLYLMGKTKWDWRSGRCVDDGCSIPSIAETLHEKGVPLEKSFPFDPDASRWPNFAKFQQMQTTALLAEAAKYKLPSMSALSEDFDVTIARVAMRDPFFWGTGWPFPNGGSAHATAGIWFDFDDRLNDFVLGMGNSHKGNEHFRCTRKQYDWAIRNSVPGFGAFHMEGAVDLRFRAQQMVM
jgi:hypothetical protein